MDLSDLKAQNPKLYFDAICRGKIPLSDIGPLTPGSISQFPLIESILGGPKPPENYTFDYKGNIPIGPSGAYPKPWRSAGQFIQDGSYGSSIGPYARFVRFVDNQYDIPDTCVKNQNDGKCGGSSGSGGIWGRLGIGAGGNILGFRAQDWYNQNEGTYNAAYWSNYFGFSGNAAWQSKRDWWASTSKATVIAQVQFSPYANAEIEVAYGSPQFDDPEYFRGLDLSVYPDFSLELLTAMVAIAAAVRWL
jgi:hypothetical protein